MINASPVTIIANAAWGPFLSGGDNIFIECARRWAAAGKDVTVCVWEEGADMCRRRGLDNVRLIVWNAKTFQRFGFFILYVARILIGCHRALKYPLSSSTIIYSASDFWPDALPAFLMKLRQRRATWIAGFYLFAPRPWDKKSPYRGANFIKGTVYWLTQSPVFWIVKKFADRVFLTSEPDTAHFISTRLPRERLTVVRGGVDIAPSQAYLASNRVIPQDRRVYDACFIGRFHEQKGVLEIVDIWRAVTDQKPTAKLAMIGDGPLMSAVKRKIRGLGLETKISLLGFKNGEDKFEVFKQSRVILHPATYDSGGMAAAEAMAWGLPGVSFDLEALKTYYPKGMLKTSCFDLGAFADNILKLLSDRLLYESVRKDALDLIRTEWSWDQRVDEISKAIFQEGL